MKKYRRDTIAAGEFKNSCLKIIDEVSKHGLPVTVTRRGKPLVRIVPARERSKRPSLKGTVVHEDADIFSTGESWDADRVLNRRSCHGRHTKPSRESSGMTACVESTELPGSFMETRPTS